jgi:predicted RNA-binding Zn ribbon-like protein
VVVERWSWLGDPLAVDLANTVRRRGWTYVDLLATPHDLADWLDREQDRLTVPRPVGAELLDRFRPARDIVLRLLRATAAGEAFTAADIHALNQLQLAAPAVRLLGPRPGTSITHTPTHIDPLRRLLAELAAATIDFLNGPEFEVLALCDAPGCGQLYLRGRPNQQWCNPHCGSRARVQRHADRHP